jgi:hypothetical protein
VIFTIDGVAQSAISLTVTGGQDEATLAKSSLGVGTHTVTAAYSGDNAFQASASPQESFQVVAVGKEPTTTQLVTPSSPVDFGQALSFVAIVTASGGGSPSGSVTFTVDGVAERPISLAVANGRDQATLVLNSLAVGTHHVVAAYSGDSAFQSSTSPEGSIQVVSPGRDGPRVMGFQRFGFHMLPTTLVPNFNEPLNPTSAQDVKNYEIVGPAGRKIAVRKVVYDPSSLSVTLYPVERLNIHKTYHFRVRGAHGDALTDTAGNDLDGADTGQPGSDYVTSVTGRDLVLPPSYYQRKQSARPARVPVSQLGGREP